MRFGVHIPTCIEGMMYPVPFARPEDILPTALLAERVGFDSVWGNDHMTTQRYVQREWPDPPNFYEPLITFTYVAARTERIKLATGIIVLPMRTMPVLAKQVATLDQLSEESGAAIGRVLPRLCRAIMKATGATAYNVLQNNGAAAHQLVMHVHFHIIPRAGDDGLGVGWHAGRLDPTAGAQLAASIAAAVAEE